MYKRFYNIKGSLRKSKQLVNIEHDDFNNWLSSRIINQIPTAVSRFGSGELTYYYNLNSSKGTLLKRMWLFITVKIETINKVELADIKSSSIKNPSDMKRFFEEYKNSLKFIDCLGSWLYLESKLKTLNPQLYIDLHLLEPFYSENPWTMALEGKKVLVIHPMTDSIQSQYKRIDKIFSNKRILPQFELMVIKAKWYNDLEHNTWSLIMDYYINELNKVDFDVAIIGCSSWGLPLTSRIKKMGKIAVTLGGATQLLFGILGQRWLDPKSRFSQLDSKLNLVNEFWVKPRYEETPSDIVETIENGLKPYW